MSAQLPLALPVGPDQRFELFVGHDWAVEVLRAASRGEPSPVVSIDAGLFVEGAEGSGKSHLLLAACREAHEAGRRARYLPVPAFAGALGTILEGLDANDLVALDGIEAASASREDCEALFHLHNRLRDAGRTLVYASRLPAGDLAWALPDLRSRLGQGLRVSLDVLDDDGRREALRRRAARRGLELDDAVLDWLFRRVDRDLKSLTALLDRLDRAAMAAQRRLTVPFVRTVTGSD
ncbi:DnaA regulatory inactivator Hda [Silanimonas sp.]|jgi:DnaA family protein|uniref:DnaA regulatory inactivator Hda n=1 Tax=Silanimonas sp. TaxID=1929290 RepID=UPI0037C706D9